MKQIRKVGEVFKDEYAIRAEAAKRAIKRAKELESSPVRQVELARKLYPHFQVQVAYEWGLRS